MIHEGAGTVIDGLARDRGVVGVHHAMDEADMQPARHQLRLPRHDACEQRVIGALGSRQLRIVPRDDMIGEPAQRVGVLARGEILEGADADVARGDAGQHRARQHGLAHHVLARCHGGERARGRNAQREHRLADDVFAQHRSERRAAVAAAGERGGAAIP